MIIFSWTYWKRFEYYILNWFNINKTAEFFSLNKNRIRENIIKQLNIFDSYKEIMDLNLSFIKMKKTKEQKERYYKIIDSLFELRKK